MSRTATWCWRRTSAAWARSCASSPALQPRADGEVPLRRVRDTACASSPMRISSRGQAKRYEVARFGELRVGENGEALLVRMLGRICSRCSGGGDKIAATVLRTLGNPRRHGARVIGY